MEFDKIISTTPATRSFHQRTVDDAIVFSILDLARFAPSGGNRQAWKVVVLKDPAKRLEIRRLYVQAWAEYMAHVELGMVPFAPIDERNWNKPAVDLAAAAQRTYPNSFCDHLEDVPVLLLVFVKLDELAVLDNGLNRQSIVGGASVYPFVHNILLTARSRGLGGVMTTTLCRREPEVAQVVGMPSQYALASLVALGWPKAELTSLRRQKVFEFTTLDTFDGEIFEPLDQV